jgi:hypothetical protein
LTTGDRLWSVVPARPWQEQWHTVRELLKVLNEHYQPGNSRRSELVKRDIENFFLQCFHLADWLKTDKASGLTVDEVNSFMNADLALSICQGFANSSKHRIRNSQNSMTVTIHSVTDDGSNASARIDWFKVSPVGRRTRWTWLNVASRHGSSF